jgi:hypothetical protein
LSCHNCRFAEGKASRIVTRDSRLYRFLYRVWWKGLLPYASTRSRGNDTSHGFVKSTRQGGNLSTVTKTSESVRASGPLSRVGRKLYGSLMPAIRVEERVVHPSSLLSVRRQSTDLESASCIDVPMRPGGVFVPRFRMAERSWREQR